MTGPWVEDPTPPEPNPEGLARYAAKMANLMAARAARLAGREPDDWQQIEAMQDRLYAERAAGRRPPRPPLPTEEGDDE